MKASANIIRRVLTSSALVLTLFGASTAVAENVHQTANRTVEYIAPQTDVPQVPPGYTGIGPVVSGSVDYDAIPSKARKFLEKHCDGHAVVKCQKEFNSGTYDIALADGIEMQFDGKGKLIGIEAPDNYSLSPTLLRAVVPGKLYNLLDHNGFKSSIESVHAQSKGGYTLEVSDPVFEHITYDPSGVLMMIIDK